MIKLIHAILINDDIKEKDIEAFEESICLNEVNDDIMFKFVMDHNVPAPSVEAIKLHNRLKEICHRIKGEYIYGQGIGQHLLLEDSSLEDKVVLSNDEHISVLGASGVIGIPISGKVQWRQVLKEGKIDLSSYQVIGISLLGPINSNVSVTDLMLSLKSKINFDKQNDIILEFIGDNISNMSLSDKVKLAGFAPELGAITAYVRKSATREKPIYKEIIEIPMNQILPVVQNEAGNMTQVSEDIYIEQGFVGGCTVGLEDFRLAASLLKKEKIAAKVRCIFSFPSNSMYLDALKEGLVDIFMDSGVILLNSGCGACWGGCQGKVSANGTVITTANRIRKEYNEQNVYLASTKAVVKSCIAGKIVLN